MTTVREAIRENNRLARMRLGQEVGDYADIPSMAGVRVLLVPLTEVELQRGLAYAAQDDEVPETFSGTQYRSRRAILSDLWHACREPGDVAKRVFESPEHMAEELLASDIDSLNMHFATLMDYASPTLDGLTEEQLDFLEQQWRKIELSELSGRHWAAAKICLSILLPELLQGKLSSTTSTGSSTKPSERTESTSDALAS